MIRPLALAIAATLGGGGCVGGDGGAVVVRWKVIDQRTGAEPSGCKRAVAERGSCCIDVGQDVIIDTVRLLVLSDGDGGAAVFPCASCCSTCSAFEHTTRFELPPATYRLSLEALRCGAPVGQTPPGVVRSVRAGEVTNLNAVEILIPAGTTTPAVCGDGGAPGCSDGGA